MIANGPATPAAEQRLYKAQKVSPFLTDHFKHHGPGKKVRRQNLQRIDAHTATYMNFVCC
jgi:hypothetical protein